MLDTMTMSMDYALATITGTKTLTGGNLEAGEFRFGLYDSNGTLIDTKTTEKEKPNNTLHGKKPSALFRLCTIDVL